MIVDCAAAAREKTHHILEWAENLRTKAMYDPRNDHSEDQPREPSHFSAAYFGVEAAKWDANSLQIMAEYKRFSTDITLLEVGMRSALRPAAFWRSKTSTYPHLSAAALWYCSVQTSAVAAERVYGIMRATEAPSKLSQGDVSWRAEIFMRYNKWICTLKWEKALLTVPSLTAGVGAELSSLIDAAGRAPPLYFPMH